MTYPPQPQQPQYYPPQQPQQSNGLAVTSMVIGIVSVPGICIPYLGWVLPILAVIFGGVGLRKANQGASGKGMAIAGLVLGVIMLALMVVFTIVGLAFMESLESELENM